MDLAYVLGGLFIALLPMINHSIEEFNKPKEITHIRHYENNVLIRYERYEDNVYIKKFEEKE